VGALADPRRRAAAFVRGLQPILPHPDRQVDRDVLSAQTAGAGDPEVETLAPEPADGPWLGAREESAD
jgi:hypothetical protein